ncbi:hypothetical protein [Halomonas daqiaonensis]|uniref:Uncharacterized protein n=1 Tax=Halomonas daqiaonensis TaxID=650850 RepID=A0A1H7WL01_9GAMM|nr:hypothetical protein [Halomonas daqiaonensis]SEM22151.1 hypothetical protein SAMN04488129_13512 [Halomonas daqiaonensis]
MFNLLMFNVDWTYGRVNVPIERVFEYTEDQLSTQFLDSSGSLLLDSLTSLPCIFCEEGTEDELAYVGKIIRARVVGRDLSLEIGFDSEVPSLNNKFLYENRIELNMPHEFEFSRNHWAVKETLHKSRRSCLMGTGGV